MKKNNEETKGKYEIQGREFRQGVLKFRQHKELIRLWGAKKVNFQQIFEVDGVMAGLKFLVDNEILDDFIRTILIGPVSEIEIDEIESGTLLAILQDFFFFNKDWIADAVNSLRNSINTLNPKEMNPLQAFWLNWMPWRTRN